MLSEAKHLGSSRMQARLLAALGMRGRAAGSGALGSAERSPAAALRLWLAWSLCASTLYVVTADGQPQWQDSGEIQVRILTGELRHYWGLALAHPLTYWLGRLALLLPLEPARAITIVVSAVPAGIAIGNLALAAWIVTRSRTAACIAAAALMLSHTYWQNATITECYGATVLLLSGEWVFLALYAARGDARWLVPLALCNGLGVSNHMLAALATPVDAALILAVLFGRRREPGAPESSEPPEDPSVMAEVRAPGLASLPWKHRLAALAAAAWIVGAMPYLALIAAEAVETGSLSRALVSATVGGYGGKALNTELHAGHMLIGIAFPLYNYPGLTIPLAIYGAFWKAVPRAFRLTLAAQTAIFYVFAVRYRVPDAHSFMFPAYMCAALLSAAGVARAARMMARRASRAVVALAAVTALWPPLVYTGVYRFLSGRGLLRGMFQNKPYRDGYATWLLPWGCARGYAIRLNEAVFPLASPGGLVLLEDDMMHWGLRYAQITGRADPAVQIEIVPRSPGGENIDEWVWYFQNVTRRAAAEGRPIVLVPLSRDRPADVIPGARWERRGDVYLFRGMTEDGP